MRPFLFALGFAGLILGFALRNPAFVLAAIPALTLMALGDFFFPRRASFFLERRTDRLRALVGEEIVITSVLRYEGDQPAVCRVTDRIPPALTLLSGEPERIEVLNPGDSLELRYRLTGKRGSYQLNRMTIDLSGGVGVRRARTVLEDAATLTFVPQGSSLRGMQVSPRKTLSYAGTNPSRKGGEGTFFFDIREYQTGDELRSVNWKRTARYPDTLFINEFEQERVAEIGIILDVRSVAYERDPSLLEDAVTAATALAENFLAQNNRVGVLIYGQTLHFVFPGFGKVQLEKIRAELATVSLGYHQVFRDVDKIPTRLFPAHSQLFFVSPLLREDLAFLISLKRRGYRLAVISPEGDTVPDRKPGIIAPWRRRKQHLSASDLDLGYRFLEAERALSLRALERSGVFALRWKIEKGIEETLISAGGRLREWGRRA